MRVKRLLDLLIVLVSAPFWFPIVIMIAVAIKISAPKDPVFFVQQRTGKDGKRFAMYKFRTMVVHSDIDKKQLEQMNVLKWPDFKIPNDPRITRIGRILRKTSLDELPQLFNIIKGDMALVGPRPTSFSPETYSLWHTERLEVVPGLTGLWQISERGVSEFDERLQALLQLSAPHQRIGQIDRHSAGGQAQQIGEHAGRMQRPQGIGLDAAKRQTVGGRRRRGRIRFP